MPVSIYCCADPEHVYACSSELNRWACVHRHCLKVARSAQCKRRCRAGSAHGGPCVLREGIAHTGRRMRHYLTGFNPREISNGLIGYGKCIMFCILARQATGGLRERTLESAHRSSFRQAPVLPARGVARNVDLDPMNRRDGLTLIPR